MDGDFASTSPWCPRKYQQLTKKAMYGEDTYRQESSSAFCFARLVTYNLLQLLQWRGEI